MSGHIYNRRKDKEDSRDHMFLVKPIACPRPTVCDLRHLDGPIEDQGTLGACTAFASTGALQFLQMQELRSKLPLNASPEEFSSAFTSASKLFPYYNERVIEGTVDQDSGGELRDVIKAIAQSGVCPESVWPYDELKFTDKPSDEAYEAATPHKITQYARLSGLEDIKSALAQAIPVVMGIYVYESFESMEVAANGAIPMPNKNAEQFLGGHAVCAIGYDDNKKCLIMRNSWGTTWGDRGYFYLPYDYVNDPSLAEDFWSIRR